MDDGDGKRLKEWRKKSKISQSELGALLGRSQGYIGDIEAGRAGLSRDLLARLLERTNVNVGFLLTGVGAMDRGGTDSGFSAGSRSSRVTPPNYAQPLSGDFSFDGTEFSLITRLEINLADGPGLIAVEGEDEKAIAVSRNWLLSHGLGADLCGLVQVKGDSMQPTVPDGALAIVNAAEMSVSSEGIYAYSRNGEAFIRRLVPVGLLKGGQPEAMVIISDNPAYPTETVSGQELNNIRIGGRVRTVLADL